MIFINVIEQCVDDYLIDFNYIDSKQCQTYAILRRCKKKKKSFTNEIDMQKYINWMKVEGNSLHTVLVFKILF